jgi:hypothetical protein
MKVGHRMPEPFLQYAGADQGKLRLSWMAPCDTRAIFIAVAEDAEFTVNRRIFVLPLVAEAILTVGNGVWYVCVGAAEGKPEQGVVTWSGIHGPIHVETTDAQPTLPTSSLPILHHMAVASAYRFHTGKPDPHVIVFEMGFATDVGTRFPLAKTKWKWVAEKGYTGWTDCWGLSYPETYAIRVSTFDAFPTRPILLGAGKVFPKVVCARTPFHRSLEDKQNTQGDGILLRQRKVDPNMKFSSHGEYLRFQAAVVRSGHDNARAVGPTHFSELESYMGTHSG